MKNKIFFKKIKYLKFCFTFCLIVFVFLSTISLGANFANATSSTPAVPLTTGDANAWTANTGTKVDAVSTNDSDTTFISSSSASGATQTFNFPGANVPSGSTINSVTLTAQVKKGSSFFSPQIQLRAQNATNSANNGLGEVITNDSTYTPISWVMTLNPFTSSAWTLSEVNNWTTKFGVAKADIFDTTTLKVTELSLTVDYTEHPAPAVNPTLPLPTCGLDIALVLDNSGSIGGNLSTMKTAFNNFVKALLPGTPTEFSVTYFDGTAKYALQTFSNSTTTVINAINNVPSSSGQTNWEDAFIKANATFDPRPGSDHPNLIIFSSDGQPNLYGPNGSLGSGGAVDQNALDAAVTQANIIKNAGTRIITLGIGSSVNQSNMVAVSSNDAYYSASDFSQLPTILDGIAGDLCGSTIAVTKIIDQDGNLQTTGDQTTGMGWQFNVAGSNKTTDTQGKTGSVSVNSGTYSVSETLQNNFSFVSASCVGATNNGTTTNASITGIQINGDDIVSCVFYNKPSSAQTASSSDVSILKTANKTTTNVGETVVFTLVVRNSGPDTATGVVASDTLPSLLTFVSATSTLGSFNASTSLWSLGNLASGATATTTITATVNPGTGGQTITNLARVSSTSNDPNTTNNFSSTNTTVNCADCGGSSNFTLTLTKTGAGNGIVSASIDNATTSTVCALSECRANDEKRSFTQTFESGTIVKLTAVPNSDSNFNGSWSGACTGTNPICLITITGNSNVNAHFGLNPTSPPSSGGGGGGVVGVVAEGEDQ